jgi:ABC-type sugar transport system permease subunit
MILETVTSGPGRLPEGETASGRAPGRTAPTGRRKARDRGVYLFVAPFFAIFIILGLFPFVYTAVLSFFRFSGFGPWKFIGARNYTSLAHNSAFTASLWNTLYFIVAIAVPLTVGGLLLAVALNNSRLRGRNIFRTLYILPFVTSSAIISIVFSSLFDSTYGWINAGLHSVGLPAIPWLVSANWSKVSVAVVVVWQFLGYNMLIMLGGLQAIPVSLYDAAHVDGCSSLRRLVHITVPMMKPTLLFALVLSTVGAVNIFTQVYILTDGGPLYSSTTPSLFLYNYAFQYGQFGVAAAAGIVLFFMTAIVSWGQFRLFLRGAMHDD